MSAITAFCVVWTSVMLTLILVLEAWEWWHRR